MARRKVTMDRVFEISSKILDEWRALDAELQLLALQRADEKLDELLRRYEDLQNRFANLITLGQDDAWRFFAESNGYHLPPDENPVE